MRKGRSQYQHDPHETRALQPLLPRLYSPATATQVERALRKGFEGARMAAEARSMDRMAMTANQLQNWQDLLDEVGEHSCGFCFVHWKLGRFASRDDAKLRHEMWNCPLSPGRNQWKALRAIPRYRITGEAIACYSCHFATKGEDRLHKEKYSSRVSGKHRHLDFVLPALWAVWLDASLHVDACRDLQVDEHNHSWDTLESLCAWLVDPAATNSLVTGKKLYDVPGMAFMEWLRRRFNIGDDSYIGMSFFLRKFVPSAHPFPSSARCAGRPAVGLTLLVPFSQPHTLEHSYI